MLSLECPQFSPPPSPGGSVLCYLEICNEEWKVKTCIIQNIKRESFISGLTFTLSALVFGILKWELHCTLRVPLIIFSGTEIFPRLKAFSFLDYQGTKTLSRLQQAIMTWCNQLLLKDKYCDGWETEQGDSWGKERCWLFPDSPLCSSSITCSGFHHSPLQVFLWSIISWGVHRQAWAGHTSLSVHPEVNGHEVVLQVWKYKPFTVRAAQIGTLLPSGHWALPHAAFQWVRITSPRKKGKILLSGNCLHKQTARSRGQNNIYIGTGGGVEFHIYLHNYEDQVVAPVFAWPLTTNMFTIPLTVPLLLLLFAYQRTYSSHCYRNMRSIIHYLVKNLLKAFSLNVSRIVYVQLLLHHNYICLNVTPPVFTLYFV